MNTLHHPKHSRIKLKLLQLKNLKKQNQIIQHKHEIKDVPGVSLRKMKVIKLSPIKK